MMNATIETMLNRRTIRAFTDEPIPQEIVDTLLKVANLSANSNGMSQYSIIEITDSQLKERLADICLQPYVAKAAKLYIFVIDVHRNAKILEEAGLSDENIRNMNSFVQGTSDGTLAAQSMVIAAQSLGLGAVFLGSILNNVDAVVELLDLPDLTFPIFGVGLGYPDQSPQLKPKMPLHMLLHENGYQEPINYHEALEEYDREMETYYDLREGGKRMDSFTLQVERKLISVTPNRSRIGNSIEKMGFRLKRED
jgi:nitroreductase